MLRNDNFVFTGRVRSARYRLGTILAGVLVLSLLLIARPAAASPSYVSLSAASGYGAGESYLQYAGGYYGRYAYTVGCGLSSQYLWAQYGLSNGTSSSYTFNWVAYNPLYGNDGSVYSVTYVMASHQIAYIGTYSSLRATNTW